MGSYFHGSRTNETLDYPNLSSGVTGEQTLYTGTVPTTVSPGRTLQGPGPMDRVVFPLVQTTEGHRPHLLHSVSVAPLPALPQSRHVPHQLGEDRGGETSLTVLPGTDPTPTYRGLSLGLPSGPGRPDESGRVRGVVDIGFHSEEGPTHSLRSPSLASVFVRLGPVTTHGRDDSPRTPTHPPGQR